ncbi:unnamed protein product [Lactuca saligna]|uniref:Integrase catalytic domain-containing protein n=1 Tax=Lactuca saligna TaxID=75948 RepID=A0AA35VHD0_LACSI|nr:unnamed protein product [Lactuca saligna]
MWVRLHSNPCITIANWDSLHPHQCLAHFLPDQPSKRYSSRSSPTCRSSPLLPCCKLIRISSSMGRNPCHRRSGPQAKSQQPRVFCLHHPFLAATPQLDHNNNNQPISHLCFRPCQFNRLPIITTTWIPVRAPTCLLTKDLNTGSLLHRVDSVSDLYPCHPSSLSKALATCDNGREFSNQLLLSYFQTNGISVCFSCPYTSPQNDKAKRSIRSINNILHTILFQVSLSTKFWVEALHTAIHTLNLLPTTTLPIKPRLSAIAPHKLSPRSSACVYLGPASDHKGHKCLDLIIIQRFIISRHVVFDEDHLPYFEFHAAPSNSELDSLVQDDDDSLSPLVASPKCVASAPATTTPSPSATPASPPLTPPTGL